MGDRFPDRSLLVEIVKVVEEPGEIASLALRAHGMRRGAISTAELKGRMEDDPGRHDHAE